MKTKSDLLSDLKESLRPVGLVRSGGVSVFLANETVKVKRDDDERPWAASSLPAKRVRELYSMVEEILNKKQTNN